VAGEPLLGDEDFEHLQFPLEGGVRVLLPNNEYELNDNLSLADRGTGCDANRRPIFN
jgi:hypothetical protein